MVKFSILINLFIFCFINIVHTVDYAPVYEMQDERSLYRINKNLQNLNHRVVAVQETLPVGIIFMYVGSSVPAGWLLCDGSAISRVTYSSLYSVIGTVFGSGDGSTTFNLPNFQRRVPVGSGGTGTSTLANTVGSTGGAETHTLTINEMPSHNHDITDSGHSHNLTDPGHSHNLNMDVTGSGTNGNKPQAGGNGTAVTGTGQPTTTTGLVVNSSTTGITINNTGGGAAHNIIQPSLVVNFIIKY